MPPDALLELDGLALVSTAGLKVHLLKEYSKLKISKT